MLIDTAGRLHTRFNLMEELKKVHRVVGKALPGAPHAIWLVLDATTGQNALAPGAGLQRSGKGYRDHPGQVGFLGQGRDGLCHPTGTGSAHPVMPGWVKNPKISHALIVKHLSMEFYRNK